MPRPRHVAPKKRNRHNRKSDVPVSHSAVVYSSAYSAPFMESNSAKLERHSSAGECPDLLIYESASSLRFPQPWKKDR